MNISFNYYYDEMFGFSALFLMLDFSFAGWGIKEWERKWALQ